MLLFFTSSNTHTDPRSHKYVHTHLQSSQQSVKAGGFVFRAEVYNRSLKIHLLFQSDWWTRSDSASITLWLILSERSSRGVIYSSLTVNRLTCDQPQGTGEEPSWWTGLNTFCEAASALKTPNVCFTLKYLCTIISCIWQFITLKHFLMWQI